MCKHVLFIFGATAAWQSSAFFLRKISLDMKGLSYQLGVNSVCVRSVYVLACGGVKRAESGVEPLQEEQSARSVLLNL